MGDAVATARLAFIRRVGAGRPSDDHAREAGAGGVQAVAARDMPRQRAAAHQPHRRSKRPIAGGWATRSARRRWPKIRAAFGARAHPAVPPLDAAIAGDAASERGRARAPGAGRRASRGRARRSPRRWSCPRPPCPTGRPAARRGPSAGDATGDGTRAEGTAVIRREGARRATR